MDPLYSNARMRHLGVGDIFVAHYAFRPNTIQQSHLREAVGRVESCLTDNSDNDDTITLSQHQYSDSKLVRVCLHSLKHNEFGLILHDLVSPAARKLCDTIDASNCDSKVRGHESEREQTELHILEKIGCGESEIGTCSADAQDKVARKCSKDDQGKDLPHDTGEHEV